MGAYGGMVASLVPTVQKELLSGEPRGALILGDEACALTVPVAEMQFLASLRDRIRRGEITCSVRLWQRCHVKVGGRYSLPPGHIVVTAVSELSLQDITPALARQSGFVGLVDLLRTAKHGPGRRVFLIEFRYARQRKAPPPLA